MPFIENTSFTSSLKTSVHFSAHLAPSVQQISLNCYDSHNCWRKYGNRHPFSRDTHKMKQLFSWISISRAIGWKQLSTENANWNPSSSPQRKTKNNLSYLHGPIPRGMQVVFFSSAARAELINELPLPLAQWRYISRIPWNDHCVGC